MRKSALMDKRSLYGQHTRSEKYVMEDNAMLEKKKFDMWCDYLRSDGEKGALILELYDLYKKMSQKERETIMKYADQFPGARVLLEAVPIVVKKDIEC